METWIIKGQTIDQQRSHIQLSPDLKKLARAWVIGIFHELSREHKVNRSFCVMVYVGSWGLIECRIAACTKPSSIVCKVKVRGQSPNELGQIDTR